jgi:FHA domain/von Willebrand factor type A domain
MLRFLTISLLLGVVALVTPAGALVADDFIHTGPAYTQGGGTGPYPQYPDLQIQVEVPPAVTPEEVKPEAFSLNSDDGSSAQARGVQTLASTGYGIAASVSIDVSGSMKGAPLQAVRSGLMKFVSDAGPADKIAIQTIADEGRWDVTWDHSREQVRIALGNLATRGNATHLWDSLLQAIHHFPSVPLSQRLIVISDGHDEGSAHTGSEVIAAANAAGIVVDAIGITRSNPIYLQGLQQITAQTGGQFRQAKDSAELERLVGSGIQSLQQTPVVSFRLQNLPPDDRTHRFEVFWKHDGKQASSAIFVKLPPAPAPSRARWYRTAGVTALLLLLALVFALIRFKKREVPIAAFEPPEAAAAVPPFVAPQAPVREPPARGAVNLPPTQEPSSDTIKLPVPDTLSSPSPVRAKTSVGYRMPPAVNGKPAAWLFCQEGFAKGVRFPLDGVEFWIGSLENNHLQITGDPTVSANHACIVVDHDVLGIYDHQSTNGTRVNDESVRGTRCLLRPGDLIRVGRSTFVLQVMEEVSSQ